MNQEAKHELREQKTEIAKHTPVPWTLYIDGSICSKNYDHSKHCIAKMEFPDLIESEIDGRFIIRAVNNHDALVAAIKAQLAALDGSATDFARMLAAHRQLEAALAAAQGGKRNGD